MNEKTYKKAKEVFKYAKRLLQRPPKRYIEIGKVKTTKGIKLFY